MNGLILAIDPSLTNTACVIGDEHGYDLKRFSSPAAGDSVMQRICRYQFMLKSLKGWMADLSYRQARFSKVWAVYIEGYSFGSKGQARFSAEYGGLLRDYLTDLTPRIYEVAPSTLKKFCTGKGDGPKDMVAAHLTKRYEVLLSNNDEYDAYGLYRLGLVAEGLEEAQNQAQRECVDKVLARSAVPKTRKKKGV